MSAKQSSLALDLVEETASNGMNSPLSLVVNKRYALLNSSVEAGSSCDVIEFGGTITVSF